MTKEITVKIVRSEQEIDQAWERAQRAAFAASDAGDTDDYAEACYSVLQWLTGNQDNDPTADLDEE